MLVRTLSIGCFLLLTLGCGADGGGRGNATPNATVHQGVYVIDATPGVDVLVEPERLVFTEAHDDVLEREAGDVLVCSNGGGFLRKVVSVHRDGANIVVGTIDATLGDAIADGSATGQSDLAHDAEGQWEIDGKYDGILPFDGKLEIGNTSVVFTPDAQVSIKDARFDFKPSVDLDLNVTNSELTYFRAIAEGTVEATMVVHVVTPSAATVNQKKILWRSAPKFLTQMIGPVPVVETVDLSIGVGTRLSTVQAVDFEAGGDLNGSLRAGATFDRESGWQAVGDGSISIVPIPISSNVESFALQGIEVYMYAEVNLRFYNLAGPYITIGPYVNTYDTGNEWEPAYGVRGTWGGKLQVMGLSAGFQSELFDERTYF
jgi:hypothetical protein